MVQVPLEQGEAIDAFVLEFSRTIGSRATQVSLTQKGVLPVQLVLQLPQKVAVSSLVRQPFSGLEHAPQPSSQSGAHVPAVQVEPPAACTALPETQSVPHPPQFASSLSRSASQPFGRFVSQSP